MDLKQTLLLPDPESSIPMKADLATREPIMQAKWDSIDIYNLILNARKDAESFVLHDGPPYTNGPIHLGTAMNKMLKDFVVKSQSLMGKRCPFVPGFDNHGLPIEQAVMKVFEEKKEKPDIETLRTACRAHAQKYVGVQTEQFRRLGVFGMWDRPWVTMEFRYEAEIVRTFKRLVEKDQVYRGLRPVQWSPSARTALADTEIVYMDHVSKAIYVRFPLREDPNGVFAGHENVHTIIWTTTPWTIPANVACAFHPEFTYLLLKAGDATYVVLKELAEKTIEKCGFTDVKVEGEILGGDIEGVIFKHPVFDRDSVAVLADYVTTEDGTGVVHTAPGHGREDFATGIRYGLPILCPVDEGGVLTHEAGEFEGTYYQKCDTVVVDRLRELGMLLSVEDYHHTYPHAERDNKPVIFRTTEQWFVSIEGNDLRERALAEIDNVEWFPAAGRNRIDSMVRNRPDWCISRQRPWGVGIPIFYGKISGEPVLDPVAIEAVAKLVEEQGSDAWFVRDAAEILPAGYVFAKTGETEFRKETDVFDVWFDSGASSLCVLEGNVEPRWKEHWPADLYLEGSDQHRGWFNQSLIIATAVHDQAPFRQVVTHGFVDDEKGEKMAKRKGNAIEPVEVCNELGADVLRYWAASVDYTMDAPCSKNILRQFGEGYRRVRNTLRFLLSNLENYTGTDEDLGDLDHWVVEQTDLLVADVMDAYRLYDFPRAINAIHNFCGQQLSAFYLDTIKDRMYCDGANWPTRVASQRASHYVLVSLVKLLTPILPHTAEEVYAMIPALDKFTSVFLEIIDEPTADRLSEIEGSNRQQRFSFLLEYRAGVFAQFEEWKKTAEIKNSQDVQVTITDSADVIERLQAFSLDLPLYFKMSWVELAIGEPEVAFEKSPYEMCERSRIRRPDVRPRLEGHMLSERDEKAVQEFLNARPTVGVE